MFSGVWSYAMPSVSVFLPARTGCASAMHNPSAQAMRLARRGFLAKGMLRAVFAVVMAFLDLDLLQIKIHLTVNCLFKQLQTLSKCCAKFR